MKKFICTICGYVHEGNTPPEACPLCGVGPELFKEVKEESNNKFSKNTEEKFVILGNGAAGFYAAKAIRERNKTAEITMVTNEGDLSYYRPALSDLINEEVNEEFYLADYKWYNGKNIKNLVNTNIIRVDEENKTLISDDGENIQYDKLILANGSSNFIPPFKGKDLDGVYTLRNIKDLERIKKALREAKKVVVIGGGALGLEAAYEIYLQKKELTVIEAAPVLLGRQLKPEQSEELLKTIRNTGTEVIVNGAVEEIVGETKVTGVKLQDGTVIEADMVLTSIGVRSNIALYQNTSIDSNRGVLVNRFMETTLENVYACGDVAEFEGLVIGLWPIAVEQGKVAGANAAGEKIEFKYDKYPLILDVFGMKFQ